MSSGSTEAIQVVSQILPLLKRLGDHRRSTQFRMFFCFVVIWLMPGIATDLLSIPMFAFYIYPQRQFSPRVLQHGHVVVPFVPGYDDIAGKVLKLGHIQNPDLRPLDDLLRGHFLQGVLKNMKGAGKLVWSHGDALCGGGVDLSRTDIWDNKPGREHLEFEMAHRLQCPRCTGIYWLTILTLCGIIINWSADLKFQATLDCSLPPQNRRWSLASISYPELETVYQ